MERKTTFCLFGITRNILPIDAWPKKHIKLDQKTLLLIRRTKSTPHTLQHKYIQLLASFYTLKYLTKSSKWSTSTTSKSFSFTIFRRSPGKVTIHKTFPQKTPLAPCTQCPPRHRWSYTSAACLSSPSKTGATTGYACPSSSELFSPGDHWSHKFSQH